ncbi:MAG TPA: phage tail tape measure protein, partial [Usitatibacter sp.]|nr:phage tail tape measure protein [Usitatibacter sp.]
VTGALGIALVAGLGAATKQALDFQEAMDKIRGLVGESQKAVEAYSKAILKMNDVPQGPKELADALFFITSAGIHGAKAIDVLHTSAKAAAAGLGTTAVVADAVTSAMNAYADANLTASNASDVLVATVREGKTAADALAPALGRVIAPAHAAGVTFNDVGAAIASMTRVGLSADESVTALRGLLLAIEAPGTASAKALKAIGTSGADLQDRITKQGLLPALQFLADHIHGNLAAGKALIPNVRALAGFLSAMGGNAKATAAIFADLKTSTGSTDAAFKAASEGGLFKMHLAIADLQRAAIPIGNLVIPIFAKLAGVIAQASVGIQNNLGAVESSVHRFITDFQNGFRGSTAAMDNARAKMHQNATGMSADVTQLGSRWDRALAQMGRDSAELRAKITANWGPIIAQGKVLAADIRSSFNSIHQAIQAVRPIIDSLGPEFKVAIAIAVLQLRLFLFWCRLAFQGAAAAIKLVAGPLSATINAFNHLAGAGVSAAKTFASGVTSAFHAVEAAVSAVVSVIEKLIGIVKSIPHDVSIHIHVPGAGIVSGAVGAIGGALGHIPHAGGGIIPLLPGTTKGADSVPALLTPGEMVLNQKQQDALGGQSALARMFGFGQMARFAAGGVAGKKPGATPHKGRGHRSHTKAIPPWASPQIAAALRHLHTLDDDKSYLDQEYSNLSTRFTIEDDDFSFVNSDGTINTGFVAQRSAELRDLIAERQKLYDKMEEQKRALVAAVKMLRKAIGILLRNLRANEVGIRHDAEQLSKLSSELAKEKGKKKPNAGRVKSLEGSIKAVRADISNRGTAKGNINRARATWGQQIA